MCASGCSLQPSQLHPSACAPLSRCCVITLSFVCEEVRVWEHVPSSSWSLPLSMSVIAAPLLHYETCPVHSMLAHLFDCVNVSETRFYTAPHFRASKPGLSFTTGCSNDATASQGTVFGLEGFKGSLRNGFSTCRR